MLIIFEFRLSIGSDVIALLGMLYCLQWQDITLEAYLSISILDVKYESTTSTKPLYATNNRCYFLECWRLMFLKTNKCLFYIKVAEQFINSVGWG